MRSMSRIMRKLNMRKPRPVPPPDKCWMVRTSGMSIGTVHAPDELSAQRAANKRYPTMVVHVELME